MNPSIAGAGSTYPRPMSPSEAELLHAFLAFDFPGVEELRTQARSLLVTGSCACGCGTVDLRPVGDELAYSTAAGPVEITGDVRDAEGNLVGGVLLFVQDGLLSLLEVHAYDGPGLAVPSLDMIEWRRAHRP